LPQAAPAATEEIEMQLIRTSEVPREPHITPLFTGPDMTRQRLSVDSKELRMGLVNFGKGMRNKFHVHSVDQILIITAGTGYVVTEKEKITVKAGDIICIPAGEKHWHGATADSEFSHFVVTRAGHKTTQVEQ
jgi:quercetin dioxygenase-like cupin family protein